MKRKFIQNASENTKYQDKRRKEMLKKYHNKVKTAEQKKVQKQQEIIAKKREIEQIKKENLNENHNREKRKLMFMKEKVIDKGRF